MGGHHFKDYYWLLSGIHISYYRSYYIQFYFSFVSSFLPHQATAMVVLQHPEIGGFPANFKAFNFKNESIIAISPKKRLRANPLKSRPIANISSCTSIWDQQPQLLRWRGQRVLVPKPPRLPITHVAEPVVLVIAVMLVVVGGESDRRERVLLVVDGRQRMLSCRSSLRFPVTSPSHKRRLHRHADVYFCSLLWKIRWFMDALQLHMVAVLAESSAVGIHGLLPGWAPENLSWSLFSFCFLIYFLFFIFGYKPPYKRAKWLLIFSK